MPINVYVVDRNPSERAWLESALLRTVDSIVFLEEGPDLIEHITTGSGNCLIISADDYEFETLCLARALRASGSRIPFIAIGPHTAFRTAVDIARLDATVFLERPVGAWRLLEAIRRAVSQ